MNISDSFYILFILDSLSYPKTRILYTKIIKWKPYFDQIQIPIWILVPNTKEEVQQYKQGIHFICDPSYELFIQNNSYKTKNVYGKNYEIIYPEINVIKNNIKLFKSKRINKNTLCKAYFICLDQYLENFKKNFRNFVDNNLNL